MAYSLMEGLHLVDLGVNRIGKDGSSDLFCFITRQNLMIFIDRNMQFTPDTPSRNIENPFRVTIRRLHGDAG